jgi:hypothetical protein
MDTIHICQIFRRIRCKNINCRINKSLSDTFPVGHRLGNFPVGLGDIAIHKPRASGAIRSFHKEQ